MHKYDLSYRLNTCNLNKSRNRTDKKILKVENKDNTTLAKIVDTCFFQKVSPQAKKGSHFWFLEQISHSISIYYYKSLT